MEFQSRRRRRSIIGQIWQFFFPSTNGASRIMLYSRLARLTLFALIIGIVIFVILFIWYGRDLPAPGKLINSSLAESTRIYDRKGVLLYSVYKDQNRAYVSLNDIPKNVQHATIAIEDRNFYTNSGFSVTGYVRSFIDLIVYRRIVSGGSTLTQQLVKNVLLQDTQQTFIRKLKELILAIQVDKRYSKDQILEMYLNDVPYGGANIGVESAAQAYFGKDVKDLDLAQSAFLAGLPQAPSVYSPFSGNKYYLARTQAVLNAMRDEGYISQKQDDSAYKEVQQMSFSDTDRSIKAPHWVMYIKQLLAQQFGEAAVDNGGLQVTTTLDYDIEKNAEATVKSEIGKLKGYHVANAAAMVMDPKTGQILAMVGNTDYFDTSIDGNYNDALANRQPGSSLKPIMYATAFEKGYTPATEVMDVKTDFPSGDPINPNYQPVNYDGKYHGPIQLRFALGNSMNIPAVKMLARVGIKDVMTNAFNMGIKNWEPTSSNIANVGLSLVLGGRETTLLDEMTAYSVFADNGVKHDPVAILKVTDSHGNTLFQNQDKSGMQVLPKEVTFLISHILLDNNAREAEFGPNSWLVVSGKTVSVKTGTTDDKKDNWTMGYTPSYVVGVWVGNNDNSAMNQAIASGVTGASPIWNKIMTYVLKGKPDEPPVKPDNVVAVTVDSLFGGLPYNNQPTRSEYFIKGTEPTATNPVYQSKDGKIYYVVRESDPVSTDGVNRWQQGIDTWITQNHSAADYQWYPPEDLLKQLNIAPTNPVTPTPTP
ncbi:MAG TPA: transglycosylase domain-containing protein [Patescibacteria group bacterium]|nr:transglycosylase domain-containing protein [Patescibacteria group bacterium]